MQKNTLVAVPCRNPSCRFNLIFPFWLAVELEIWGIQLLCPVCRYWWKRQVDGDSKRDDEASPEE